MSRRIGECLLVAVVAAALTGCGAGSLFLPRPFALSRADGGIAPTSPPAEFLPWAASEPVLVVVDKDRHELAVIHYGQRDRVFPAVFGRVDGRKLFEGDKRTPSGIYRITRKRLHRRFHRFFDLDYPNPEDVRNFRAAQTEGLVPVRLDDGRRPGPGGLVGIHGTNDENMNRLMVDWTLGCVSLTNAHIDELDGLVPEGTLVLIRGRDAALRLDSLEAAHADRAGSRRYVANAPTR